MTKQEIFREVDKLQSTDIKSVIAYCRFALCSRGVDPDKTIEHTPPSFPEEKGKPLSVVFKNDTDKDIIKEMLDKNKANQPVAYKFTFLAEDINIKYGKPYVCKLHYNFETQKMERDYIKLRESNPCGSVNGLHETFQGDYTLDNHEVVEVYTGKTERNIMSFIERKKLYFVCEEGSLLEVKGDRIKLWLMGEMTWKDLWL